MKSKLGHNFTMQKRKKKQHNRDWIRALQNQSEITREYGGETNRCDYIQMNAVKQHNSLLNWSFFEYVDKLTVIYIALFNKVMPLLLGPVLLGKRVLGWFS